RTSTSTSRNTAAACTRCATPTAGAAPRAARPSRSASNTTATRNSLRLRLRQQALDLGFGFCVIAFAEMAVDDVALFVDQIQRWPVTVVVGVPGGIVIVLRHRILDAKTLDRLGHVIGLPLKGEFGRMHANHRQPLVTVFLVPLLHIRQRVDA